MHPSPPIASLSPSTLIPALEMLDLSQGSFTHLPVALLYIIKAYAKEKRYCPALLGQQTLASFDVDFLILRADDAFRDTLARVNGDLERLDEPSKNTLSMIKGAIWHLDLSSCCPSYIHNIISSLAIPKPSSQQRITHIESAILKNSSALLELSRCKQLGLLPHLKRLEIADRYSIESLEERDIWHTIATTTNLLSDLEHLETTGLRPDCLTTCKKIISLKMDSIDAGSLKILETQGTLQQLESLSFFNSSVDANSKVIFYLFYCSFHLQHLQIPVFSLSSRLDPRNNLQFWANFLPRPPVITLDIALIEILKKVESCSLNIIIDSHNFRDFSALCNAVNFSKVTELSLQDFISNEILLTIIAHMPRLRSLSFSFTGDKASIWSAINPALFSGFNHVTELTLLFFPEANKHLQEVVEAMPKLNRLNIVMPSKHAGKPLPIFSKPIDVIIRTYNDEIAKPKSTTSCVIQ